MIPSEDCGHEIWHHYINDHRLWLQVDISPHKETKVPTDLLWLVWSIWKCPWLNCWKMDGWKLCENEYFSKYSLELYFTNTIYWEMDGLNIFENFHILYVLNLYICCPLWAPWFLTKGKNGLSFHHQFGITRSPQSAFPATHSSQSLWGHSLSSTGVCVCRMWERNPTTETFSFVWGGRNFWVTLVSMAC